MPPTEKTGFERLFERRMKDPKFAREFARAKKEIDEVDRLIRELDAARALEGINKTALARELRMIPSAVRRLLTMKGANPAIRTLLRLGHQLGYTLRWEPVRRSTHSRAPRRAHAEAR
jgi:DNA-binding phage protein